jgi:hypothetical protein
MVQLVSQKYSKNFKKITSMLPIFGLSLFSWIVAILAITQNCPKNTVAACEPVCRSVAALSLSGNRIR